MASHIDSYRCGEPRAALLTKDSRRPMLAKGIDRAMAKHGFALAAFVFMPEHVHLAVYPDDGEAEIESLLYAVKRPYWYRIKQILRETGSPLLKKLTVPWRRGNTFRYRQKSPRIRPQSEDRQGGVDIRGLHPRQSVDSGSASAGRSLEVVRCPMVLE